MNLRETGKLVGAIALCQLAGILGSLATMPNIPTWYASLNKPFFSPPNWVFAPVWITLYALMGIALYLVWNKGIQNKDVKAGVMLFGGQLALNAAWSFLFFGMHSPLLGLAGIIPLWALIVLTIRKFYPVSKLAAYLMVPYLLWVSFATILNLSLWMLN